jgi:hypothetical protein
LTRDSGYIRQTCESGLILFSEKARVCDTIFPIPEIWYRSHGIGDIRRFAARLQASERHFEGLKET